MRILWTHNFNPDIENNLVFVSPLADALRKRGVSLTVEYLGDLRSLTGILRAARRVRSLARNFDLIHAQYGSACAFVTAFARDIPKVVVIRGNDWNRHDEVLSFYHWHTRAARWLTRYSFPHFDVVLAVSNRLKSKLSAEHPQGCFVRFPSPIDLDLFRPHDKAEARRALGEPRCTERWVLFNALSIGDPIKRFALAKEAFDIANAEAGNLRLRIASNIPHSELPTLISACDLILCTSETEGWPNSVKEALACNVPFVSTDVSDLPDIARQEPSCKICPPEPRALANAILAVLSLPRPHDLRKHVLPMGLGPSCDMLIDLYANLIHRSQ